MADSSNNSHVRKYFHDRFVLLMLTVNIFLAVICVVMILLRLGDTGSSYIQSYRSNLGLNAYSVGDVKEIISFAAFSLIVLVGQFFISMKLHPIRKHASWIVMVLAGILLILSLVISNALLQLR
jgi:hypothetical protein